jgi:hypothetical protein
VVVALLAAVPCVAAAADADLAGRWTLVTEAPAPGAATPAPRIPPTASSGWGREITITRDGASVVIERHQFTQWDMQPAMRLVYALDGSESRNAVNMGRGPQEQFSTATFDGRALVLRTRHVGPPASDVTHTFSLEPGGLLVVETRRSGAAAVTTARYRRQPPPNPAAR